MASPYGQFILSQLPNSVKAGDVLKCWVEFRVAAVKGIKAENDLTLELVCLATCKTSAGVVACEEAWSVGRILAPFKEGGRQKTFDQGTHSYIVHVDVPSDCFPSVPQAFADQNGVHAEFAITYVLRCKFPSRDTPITHEQSIAVVQDTLSPALLTPLVMQDRSPLGISVTARARRGQWHAERPATLFYSFKSPFKSEVPTVLVEILQKISLPKVSYSGTAEDRPSEAADTQFYENVVATYPLPPVPANSVSNFTVKLSPVPYMAPSMYLGPIDVDYEIRIVAVFPPPPQGGNPIVEFLATTSLNLLPASQEIDIVSNFDDVDESKAPDANEVQVLLVPPVLPQQQFAFPPPGQFPPQQAQFPGPPPGGFFPPPPQPHMFNIPPPQTHGTLPHQPSHFSTLPIHHVLTPADSPVKQFSKPVHHSASVSVFGQDTLESRLKRAEASQDAVRSDGHQLPGYSANSSNVQDHFISPTVAAIGGVFGGVVQRKSADFTNAPPPGQPQPQAYNLQNASAPGSNAEDQRLQMQQEELERIKEERAKLLREAELMRQEERARQKKLEEDAQKARDEAIAAEKLKVEQAKQAEMDRVLEERRQLEAEMKAIQDAERAKLEMERQIAEEAERLRLEEEARKAEAERLRLEEEERVRAEAEARRIEEERLRLEEARRVEEEKRRAEDEKIEALRKQTEEARRQLELGKKELEEKEQLRLLEQELEQLRLAKEHEASKIAAQKQLEELNRQAEVERLKKQAELRAEKLRLEAELKFAKEQAENEKLKEEIERLKALKSGAPVAAYALGNVARTNANDDDDDEPLQKGRNQVNRAKTNNFYKAVAVVREQTKHANASSSSGSGSGSGSGGSYGNSSSSGSSSGFRAAAATPAVKSPTEENLQHAYNGALDSYRNRLLTHLSFTGSPVTGREQAVARDDELMAARKVLSTSSKGSSLLSALEAEMRVIESEILEGYENQLYQQMREKILDSKTILKASFDAGLIRSTKELNEECKAALEGIKVEGDVSGRVYERAKVNFEETVRQPLLKLVAAKERGASGSSGPSTSSSSSTGSANKCKRIGCHNTKAAGKNFCSYNCELMSS
ncbi:UNVERIFIED_CONTAM: hypothetical protein HDU68_008581 [Siphonaria sp. JEL0065]|nr:hypothetical protein HDU68_008581 [Siphonaria sp. JEL0065]